MAGTRKQPTDEGMVSRLAGRGEEALTRLMDELGKNEHVTDALGRAMAAKGRVDETTRKTLGTIGLTSSQDLQDIMKRLERLEKRMEKVEGGRKSSSTSRARKTSSSTRTRTTTPRKTS